MEQEWHPHTLPPVCLCVGFRGDSAQISVSSSGFFRDWSQGRFSLTEGPGWGAFASSKDDMGSSLWLLLHTRSSCWRLPARMDLQILPTASSPTFVLSSLKMRRFVSEIEPLSLKYLHHDPHLLGSGLLSEVSWKAHPSIVSSGRSSNPEARDA